MVDIGELLGVVGALLATVGGIAWALCHGISLFFRARPHLRGHLFAAVLWTMVTVFQTGVVLLNRSEPHTIGQGVALIAGFVMIASWAQFWERQDGMMYRQDKRPLLSRLFTQSLWGIVALLGMACAAQVGADGWLNRAVTTRDIPTIKHLRAAGFGDEWGDSYSLLEAIRNGDEPGVRAYLAAGAEVDVLLAEVNTTPFEAAVSENNVAITKLLFAHGEPYTTDTPLLLRAVENGQWEQARFLIGRGVDVNEVSEKTHFTALQIAKQRGNQPMVVLLKSAGATR